MVGQLGTILCYVSDMSKAVAFYRDTCGLPLQTESPGWSQFDLGNQAALGLHAVSEDVKEASLAVHGWTIGFNTPSLVALKQRLEAGGGQVGAFHQTPRGVNLDFQDPDGNQLSALQEGSDITEFEN